MPAQDIYGDIVPKKQGQSDSEYDAYLDSIANERLPIVTPNSVSIFKRNALSRIASVPQPISNVNPSQNTPVSRLPASASVNTQSIPAQKVDLTPNTFSDKQAQDILSFSSKLNDPNVQDRLADEELRQRVIARNDAQNPNSFLNQAKRQSPEMRRQAELEANKYSVQKKNADIFNQRLSQVKMQNPDMDELSVYNTALAQQSQADLQIQDDIKKIGRNTFDQLAKKSQLAKLAGDDEELNNYLNSEKFRFDAYTGAGGNPRLIGDIGREIIERKKLEKENAPTRIAQMQQVLLDDLHAGNDPVTRALYYGMAGAVSGIQSLVKLGGAGAAAINAATGFNSLSEQEKKGSFRSRFSKLNQKNREILGKYSPEAKAVTESEGDIGAQAIRLIGKFGAAGYAKLPLLGTLGKSELFTNNLLTQSIKSMPIQKVAAFMDNYAGMAKSIGPIIYGDYYEQMKAKGYNDEEAADKALTRTGINLAAFSALSPFQGAPKTKILESLLQSGGGNVSKLAKQIGSLSKDATKVTAEGVGAVTADAYQDFRDAKEKGFISKDEVFDPATAIKEGLMAAPVNVTAILGNRLIGGHGKLPDRNQSEVLSQAITDRPAFESELRNNIRRGRMTEQEASKALGLIDTIAPFYEEGLGFQTKDGQPYTPGMAVQHAVERARFQESFDKLTQVREQLKDIQIGELNGEPMPMANENGTYSVEAYERLKKLESKYKSQVEKSARSIEHLQNGDYTLGQLLTAEDILGSKPIENEEVIRKIEDNGPYESTITPVSDIANDPIVQERISEIQTNPDVPLNIEEPITIDSNGKVISGHDTIADAIINGDVTVETMKSPGSESITGMIESPTGDIKPNKEGLDKDQSRILDEIKYVFDKAKETVGEGGAFSAAAADIAERGYTRNQAIDQLLRLVNGEVSRPVAEFYYNDALKRQQEQSTESKLSIEENEPALDVSDRIDTLPDETLPKSETNKPEDIKKGVSEIFEGNTELSSIGTKEQYDQYLKTIFPTSKMRDIVYHRSNAKFDEFDFNRVNPDTGGGFDFAKGSGATQYGENLYPSLLDIGEFKPSYERTDPRDGTMQPTMYDDYIYSIYNPEQVHILGSKRDIDGFRKFVESEISSETNEQPKTIYFEFAGDQKTGEVISESPVAYRVKDSKGIVYTIPKDVTEKSKDNYDKVIDFLEKLKSKPGGAVYSSILPITPELLNKGIDLMIATVKATRSVAKGIDAMVDYFRSNGSDVTREQVEEYISQSEPPKRPTSTQREINKDTGVSRDNQVEMSNLKSQIRMEARAAKEGYKAGKKEGRLEGEIIQGRRMAKEMRELQDRYESKIEKATDKADKERIRLEMEAEIAKKNNEQESQRYIDFANNVTDYLKSAVKSGTISSRQGAVLASRAAKIGKSQYRLDKFLEYAEKVFDNADYVDKVSNATTLQQRIRKATKSASTFADHLPVLDDLKRIPIENLSAESLDKFIDISEQYTASKLPVSNENYAPFNLENARNTLADIQSELDQKIIDKAEELTGLSDLSAEDSQMVLDALDAENPDVYIDNLEASKKKALTDALRTQASYSQMGAKDVLSDPLFTENIPKKGVDMLRQIANADLTNVDAKSLVPLIKTLDNSITNGSIANVGKVYDAVRSVNDAETLKKLNTQEKLFQLNKLQEATESLPVLLKSIFGHSSLASNFRRLTGFDDVFNGGSKTELSLNRTHKSWENYKKENKIGNSAEDRYSRGMYAVLIQNEGGNRVQVNDQFLINKRKIEQSIEAMKQRISTQKEADALEKVYMKDFAPFDNVEQMQSDYASKYPEQVKAVKFFQDQFGSIKNELKFITEAYQNERFEEVNNYTPLSYRFIDNSLSQTPEAGMYFVDRYTGRPKQTPTTISRSGSSNIPTGTALDLDFDFNMFNKLKRANYDINTIGGRSKFSEMSKLKNFTESVGGGDNKERLIRQYNKAERTQAGDKSENDAAGELMQYVLSPARKLAGSFALGGFTQLPKQYISVGIKTLFTLGKDAPILLDVMKNANNRKIPLLELASISNRGSRQGGVNIGDNLPLENRAAEGVRKVLNKYGTLIDRTTSLALKPLEFGDSSIARQSWLSYYMKYMKDHGQPIDASELATEHERIDPLREEAMSYANQMVDETQVVSNAALQADLSRNQGNQWKEVLRNIFVPFNTFSANTRARMVEDFKFARYGNAAQRAEALRDLAGNAAEMAAFNSLKIFALKYLLYEPGKDFLNWVFGLNIKDDNEQEALLRDIKRMRTDMIKDVTVSGIGSLGENSLIDAFNGMQWIINRKTDPDFKVPYSEFIKKDAFLYPNHRATVHPLLDQMGSYGILPKELLQDYRDIEGAVTGSYLNEYAYTKEKESDNKSTKMTIQNAENMELDSNQQNYLKLVAAADALGLLGLRDADVMRILQSTKKSMFQNDKKK